MLQVFYSLAKRQSNYYSVSYGTKALKICHDTDQNGQLSVNLIFYVHSPYHPSVAYLLYTTDSSLI